MSRRVRLMRGRRVSRGVRRPARWLLYGGRPAGRFVIRRRYDVRLHHADRVPRRGPVILAANHVGVADGPMVAIFCAATRPTPSRRSRCSAASWAGS